MFSKVWCLTFLWTDSRMHLLEHQILKLQLCYFLDILVTFSLWNFTQTGNSWHHLASTDRFVTIISTIHEKRNNPFSYISSKFYGMCMANAKTLEYYQAILVQLWTYSFQLMATLYIQQVQTKQSVCGISELEHALRNLKVIWTINCKNAFSFYLKSRDRYRSCIICQLHPSCQKRSTTFVQCFGWLYN